jgi:hypothetical protein
MSRRLRLALALTPFAVMAWAVPAEVAGARPCRPSSPPSARPAVTVRPLQLPDGTQTAPLNGITEPGRMNWGNRPYAPIVGTVHCQGVDWYRHADGSLTTTVEVYRSDLGRRVPVTLVAHQQGAE